MAAHICTNCGYEGRGKHHGPRRGGTTARIAGMMLLLPVHTLWQVFGSRAGKFCPHCGLPRMVKLTSAEGEIARRKMDLELGILPPVKKENPAENSFGNERPQERVTKKPVDPEQW